MKSFCQELPLVGKFHSSYKMLKEFYVADWSIFALTSKPPNIMM